MFDLSKSERSVLRIAEEYNMNVDNIFNAIYKNINSETIGEFIEKLVISCNNKVNKQDIIIIICERCMLSYNTAKIIVDSIIMYNITSKSIDTALNDRVGEYNIKDWLELQVVKRLLDNGFYVNNTKLVYDNDVYKLIDYNKKIKKFKSVKLISKYRPSVDLNKHEIHMKNIIGLDKDLKFNLLQNKVVEVYSK